MKAQAKEAKKLSKLLGEDHDLAVLADTRRRPRARTRLIAERREGAARAARALGRRIYAERPKALRAPAPAATWTGAPEHGGRAQVRPRGARRTGSTEHPRSALAQGYLAIDPAGAEVRVRRKDDETLMTVKIGIGLVRGEEEFAIDADRFERLWALTDGPPGGQDALLRPARRTA